MKTDMRQELARRSFEEKIRRVAELIRLARKVHKQRVRETAPNYPHSAFSNPE